MNCFRANLTQNIKTCYIIVYDSQNEKKDAYKESWKVEIRLFYDVVDDSYHLLAWKIKSQQILLNANCTAECLYQAESQKSHYFINQNGQKFGLKFDKSESAKEFQQAVIKVLEMAQTKKKDNELSSTNQNSNNWIGGLPPPNPDDEDVIPLPKPMNQTNFLPPNKLKQCDFQEKKLTLTPILKPKIDNVTKFKHLMHVTRDKKTGKLDGLMEEWKREANKQFGVKLEHRVGVIVAELPQYQAKIPQVLVTLKENLQNVNGYEQEGIFRTSSNKNDMEKIKSLLDQGDFDISAIPANGNVYADLIKEWFRELPDRLLDSVPSKNLKRAFAQEHVIQIIKDLTDPYRSIFLWLCDLFVECAAHETINKMSPQNLARIMAPNLFNEKNSQDPLTHNANMITFLEHAIKWRQTSLN